MARNKVLSSLHPRDKPKKRGPRQHKKIKINKKNVKNHRKDTKARVDKHPLISYIERMKGRNMKTVTINVSGASQSQWSTFLLELNLMKKAWKRYGVDAELKAKSLTKIINLERQLMVKQTEDLDKIANEYNKTKDKYLYDLWFEKVKEWANGPYNTERWNVSVSSVNKADDGTYVVIGKRIRSV